VLSHPDALVVAGDPLQVTVTSARTRIIVAMLIGQGEAPVGLVTGSGAESVLDVAGLRMHWDPASDRLQVNQTNGPIARFHSSNDYGTPGTEVVFDATASTDGGGGTIVAWHWDFGDGTIVTTAVPTTTH
ncbi:PKD domain-containing protein, partial [Arthrospira platensis SPKY1]|nr:PKD domain-containing protein [Arthrospira platensis SPKY1]